MKRFHLLLTLAGLAALLFAMPVTAKPTRERSHLKDVVKTQVKVVSSGQGGVKSSGKLKVKVSVKISRKASKKVRKKIRKKPVKVTLRGSSSVVWSPRSNTSLYAKTVKLRPGKSRTVAMKLNATGKSKAGDCGAPTFKVNATYRSGKRKKVAKASRKLSAQKSLCDVPADVDLTNADKCDFIAGSGNACLAPFPNDFYTKEDSASDTGRRLDLDPESTPANKDGKHIATNVLNQSDGFSPGPLLTVRIPGMDNEAAFTQSGIVSIKQMSRAFEPSQPVVLIDAATGDRQLIWAELDSNATSDANRNLIIRPGKNLEDGHRYIVALRNLKDASGNPIQAPPGFRLYRDTDRTDNPVVEGRRDHFESIFDDLAKAGIERGSLYLAWDFTVASTENLTGRMISIRDRAFHDLGDDKLTDGEVQGNAPDYTITSVEDFPTATGNGVEDARIVKGTYTVPCFLNQDSCPSGATFNLDADQKPVRIPGNTMQARFSCNIPRSAVDTSSGSDPANWTVDHEVRPSLYGHGLFGSIDEVTSKNIRQLGTENGVLVCGTDWIGMSEGDLGTAVQALADLSKFPALPDRLQQGFLNFLFLGRLLIHPDGLASDPAFKYGGQSVIDTSDLFYYGNSQGGIAGGALTSVATDFTRSVLYVPGMNYSTLLTRSTDFTTYASILYPSYKQELERPSIFSLLQTMWDRGEPNGYANHMTSDPLPNTPKHKVMIEMAYGDHQVANVATEVEARTIGAPLRVGTGGLDAGVVDPDRHPTGLVDPFYGHDTLGDLATSQAKNGNAFFVWDIGPQREEGGVLYGTDPAPLTNTPPTTGESDTPLGETSGIDPHDTVIRSSPLIRAQIADFIKTDGVVTNPCGNDPCYAAGYHGFP